MNLYGSDMDESTLPIEAGLGWTISWQPENRDFIGRSKLMERQIAQDHNRQCGLVLMDKGVLRNNQKVVIDGIEQGKITSGGYSPTLECSIGFARIPMSDFNKVSVELRGNILEARVVKLPFVRHNKALIDLKMLR
jgi:aminomethyltransferase